jgi:hypothetical protein
LRSGGGRPGAGGTTEAAGRQLPEPRQDRGDFLEIEEVVAQSQSKTVRLGCTVGENQWNE